MLKVLSCSKGFTLVNSQCILNKLEWSNTIAETDAITGVILSCKNGYYHDANQKFCFKAV